MAKRTTSRKICLQTGSFRAFGGEIYPNIAENIFSTDVLVNRAIFCHQQSLLARCQLHAFR